MSIHDHVFLVLWLSSFKHQLSYCLHTSLAYFGLITTKMCHLILLLLSELHVHNSLYLALLSVMLG